MDTACLAMIAAAKTIAPNSFNLRVAETLAADCGNTQRPGIASECQVRRRKAYRMSDAVKCDRGERGHDTGLRIDI